MFRIVNLEVGPYCDANMLLLKIPALIHIGGDAQVIRKYLLQKAPITSLLHILWVIKSSATQKYIILISIIKKSYRRSLIKSVGTVLLDL